MVVLIGSGHVAYGLGAQRQTRAWFDGRMASVIPIPIADGPDEPRVERVQASYADFVWGLPVASDPLYPSTGIATPEAKSGERYRVIMVAKGSPAAAADFAVGDELVSIDGLPIGDKEVSNRHMATKRWGDTVTYRVVRGGEERTLTVHLRRRAPADSTAAGGATPDPARGAPTPAGGAAPPAGMPGARPGGDGR
jgi:hypothetical protein